MTNGINNNSFSMPKKHWLPFFAYGLFEPGKKDFSKIAHYINGNVNVDADYRSIEKDGVPILMRIKDNNYKTSGHVLRFKNGKKAYEEICDIISDPNLSEKFIWDTIEIGRYSCNALVLKGPEDINLPFFAYGIFKPGEIAYSKIKDYIDVKKGNVINYRMKHRDGVPILLPKEHERNKTWGYVFYFNNHQEAYKIIDQTIPNELYCWNTINIGTDKMNVLFGKDPNNGSNTIEDACDKVSYNGQKDPLFKDGIELIRENLKSSNFHWEKGFFQLQMNYMLLWSAIDRYCKLKYNKDSEWQNREELSDDKLFKDSLSLFSNGKLTKTENRVKYRPIFTTDDLTERKFNINYPKWCLNYFYTLRCNIVHRGKSSFKDIDLLEQATYDLLDIFEYIKKETFKDE